MSWNFILLTLLMYVRCDERHCIPGLTMSNSPDGELQEVWILKWCTQGLARTRIVLCQRSGADTEETGRYDFVGSERLWKVLMLSK